MALIVAVTAVTKLERFGYQLVARSQETCRLSTEGGSPNMSRVVRVRCALSANPRPRAQRRSNHHRPAPAGSRSATATTARSGVAGCRPAR